MKQRSFPAFLLAVTGLCVAGGSAAAPAPQVNFNIVHYEVQGKTTDEIQRSLFERTPVLMPGGRYGAVTHNRIRTNYSAVGNKSGGCEIKNVRVVLDSTVVLPRLVTPNVSPAVRREWDRYINALAHHEQLHANNGKHIAQTVSQRLFGLKSQHQCDVTLRQLKSGIDHLIKGMAKWDDELDRRTNHGRSQGAFLQEGIR